MIDDTSDMPELNEQTLVVRQMFQDRDDDYVDATQKIVDIIGPTLLTALYQLFQVPPSSVRWLDFSSADTIMVVTCSITYNPSQSVPLFLSATLPFIPKVSSNIEQTIRIGVPYEFVLDDPAEILDFFKALVISHSNGGPTLFEYMEEEYLDQQDTFGETVTYSKTSEFNTDDLTDAQKQQLAMFTTSDRKIQ